MQEKTVSRSGPSLVLVLLASIPLTYFFADRPIAAFMFQHEHNSRAPFVALTHLVDVLVILAVLGLAWSLFVFARGRAFDARGQIALRATLALFAAMGVKELLK